MKMYQVASTKPIEMLTRNGMIFVDGIGYSFVSFNDNLLILDGGGRLNYFRLRLVRELSKHQTIHFGPHYYCISGYVEDTYVRGPIRTSTLMTFGGSGCKHMVACRGDGTLYAGEVKPEPYGRHAELAVIDGSFNWKIDYQIPPDETKVCLFAPVPVATVMVREEDTGWYCPSHTLIDNKLTVKVPSDVRLHIVYRGPTQRSYTVLTTSANTITLETI